MVDNWRHTLVPTFFGGRGGGVCVVVEVLTFHKVSHTLTWTLVYSYILFLFCPGAHHTQYTRLLRCYTHLVGSSCWTIVSLQPGVLHLWNFNRVVIFKTAHITYISVLEYIQSCSRKFSWGPIFVEGQSLKFSWFRYTRLCPLYTVQSCHFRGRLIIRW